MLSVTNLLGYRAVSWPSPQRLAPLMAGLTAGALIVGILVTFAEPSRSPPTGFVSDGLHIVIPGLTTPAPSTATTPTSTTQPAAAVPLAPVIASGPLGAILGFTNAQRAAAGCAPLRSDGQLARAAQAHARDMANGGYFSHDSRDGRSFADRILAAGYPGPGGENIAYGQSSPDEVVRDWMDSPGHRENILNCEFTTLGVGYDPDGNYWVQDFGY